jgi:hypothetical protein
MRRFYLIALLLVLFIPGGQVCDAQKASGKSPAKRARFVAGEKAVSDFVDSLSSDSFVCMDTLLKYRETVPEFVDGFLGKYPFRIRTAEAPAVRQQMIDSLDLRLELRAKELASVVVVEEKEGFDAFYRERVLPFLSRYGWYCLAGLALLVLLLIIRGVRKKKEASRPTFASEPASSKSAAQPEIIVRRKTTSILKRQSLEDVLHNDAYMKINCSDFCADSAVRKMFIKNTCIKEIYNMYADDLRNPENPKEDGCMVLGRWVHDSQTDEYYVSLEHVVLPGDDAVFQEYELNFGGKIKLRVAEKLRRLRQSTDLQYDLTCWVHSHPGLGVFFSNYDNSVHLQLKHATHPKFLTAIVVDILTPDMELGIFTFKHKGDLIVNSKQDLTRMYSLEKMYQWALESDRSTFKPEDHYNVLASAPERDETCDGIQLGNGAIIDICQMVAEQKTGLAGFGFGYPNSHGITTDYVIEKVSAEKDIPDYEMLGCFIIGSHLSLPSIQKAVGDYAGKCKFVMFYSTAQETLVSMPVRDGELIMDEKYYSEEKLEKLKIWTRRRR